MTKDQIKYGNRLIALYMGGIEREPEGLFMLQIKNNKKPYYIFYTRLKYHRSWDWLMLVCKKIIESYFDERSEIFQGLTECDIEKTFDAVVKFIEFWNDPNQIKLTWNKRTPTTK